MAVYTSLPITVQAVQYLGGEESVKAVSDFCEPCTARYLQDGCLNIATQESTLLIRPTDWVLYDVADVERDYMVMTNTAFIASFTGV